MDKDLITFLESEIGAERSQTALPKSGPGVPGFEVKVDGARVVLTRKVGNENVTVKFTVNGSLDHDGPSEEEMDQMAAENPNSPPPMGDVKSRPEFLVEVAKLSGRILAFSCFIESLSAYTPNQAENEKFRIDNFALLNADQVDGYADIILGRAAIENAILLSRAFRMLTDN